MVSSLEAQSISGAFLRATTVAFLVGWGLHVADQLRRGLTAEPGPVIYLGIAHILAIAVAAALIALRHRRAPEAAIIVGLGSMVGFTWIYLLPTSWPILQDSLLDGHRTGVTWFSWLGVVTALLTALAWTHAASRALVTRD